MLRAFDPSCLRDTMYINMYTYICIPVQKVPTKCGHAQLKTARHILTRARRGLHLSVRIVYKVYEVYKVY